jgi:hypothetical protein
MTNEYDMRGHVSQRQPTAVAQLLLGVLLLLLLLLRKIAPALLLQDLWTC